VESGSFISKFNGSFISLSFGLSFILIIVSSTVGISSISLSLNIEFNFCCAAVISYSNVKSFTFYISTYLVDVPLTSNSLYKYSLEFASGISSKYGSLPYYSLKDPTKFFNVSFSEEIPDLFDKIWYSLSFGKIQ